MLDIGFLELLIIAVVGLLVLGPERLPRAARTTGMWVGKIKRTVAGMQREVSAQLEAEDLRQKLDDQQKKLDDSLNKAKQDVESLADAPGKQARQVERQASDASARLDDALDTLRETPPEAGQDGKKDETSHER
ncbi:Sec-independent protein translocase protein TatB [Halomonas garicola]|uniref:Sec-independent protein translocase protein TatB n=1 Tax=Halomonas garicola TaxID=1690008 RepID=UPI00289B00BC|nr:Sec-independent protein translocase protein TatB [Halomonas garicola]